MTNNNSNIQVIKAKIIAIGSCGSNILVDFIRNKQLRDISYLFVNSKSAGNTLRLLNPSQTLLLDDKSKELGFELNPDLAERAALLAEQEIKTQLADSKLLFILAGMGGATGTGASHIFAKVAKTLKSMTIAIVVEPFDFEDQKRLSIASEGIEKLQKNSDALIVISNTKIQKQFEGITVSEVWKKANQIIFDIIKTIIDLISKPAFMQIDFSILKKAIRNNKKLFVNSGIGFGKHIGDRAKRAAISALNDSIIDFDFKQTKEVIIIISVKNSFIEENEEIVKTIIEFLESKGARNFEYSIGIYLAPELDENIKVGLIISADENTQNLKLQLDYEIQKEPQVFEEEIQDTELEQDDDFLNPFTADF